MKKLSFRKWNSRNSLQKIFKCQLRLKVPKLPKISAGELNGCQKDKFLQITALFKHVNCTS